MNSPNAISTLFLGHNGPWWDFWLLMAVLIAGPVAAAAIGITTAGSIIAHARETEAAKAELARVQAETDGKIADAHKEGLGAGEKAGNAQAAVDAAKVQIETARAEAAKANERGAQLSKDAEQARLETERLKAANLDLAKAVSPRVLEQGLTGKALRQFADIAVVTRSLSDLEPRQTAGQILWMLRQEAGWQRPTIELPPSSNLRDGVVVHVTTSVINLMQSAAKGDLARDEQDRQIRAAMEGTRRGREAAEALVKILNEAGIEASVGAPMPAAASGVLLVEVGSKPLPRSLQVSPENMPADENGNKRWGNMMIE